MILNASVHLNLELEKVLYYRWRFLCVTDSLLGPPLTDFIETLRVYGADPELVQRHTFDFRFQPRTGSELFFHKPEVQNFGTRSQKYSRSKEKQILGHKYNLSLAVF